MYSKKSTIKNSTSGKINFHASLTKQRSLLLQSAQEFIKDTNGVQLCFADSHGNLKVKLTNDKNFAFDSIQSLGSILDYNLPRLL